mmetsp:Transcript_19246/g.28408  ORF Transcript_19246/g.28408 Transcript_19246/m.28408 type:complete len:325 (-) Transcript_19246:70-1044(-)
MCKTRHFRRFEHLTVDLELKILVRGFELNGIDIACHFDSERVVWDLKAYGHYQIFRLYRVLPCLSYSSISIRVQIERVAVIGGSTVNLINRNGDPRSNVSSKPLFHVCVRARRHRVRVKGTVFTGILFKLSNWPTCLPTAVALNLDHVIHNIADGVVKRRLVNVRTHAAFVAAGGRKGLILTYNTGPVVKLIGWVNVFTASPLVRRELFSTSSKLDWVFKFRSTDKVWIAFSKSGDHFVVGSRGAVATTVVKLSINGVIFIATSVYSADVGFVTAQVYCRVADTIFDVPAQGYCCVGLSSYGTKQREGKKLCHWSVPFFVVSGI